MTSVAAYVRMSTDMQRYSIDNQLAAIEAYCHGRDLELARIYSDAGRSGIGFNNRPGLRALVEDAERGGLPFTNVIVFDVSRWGRFQDVDEGAYYEHILRKAGAPVIYCGEAFEADGGPVAAIVKSLKRVMAAEYSRELSRRVSHAKRRLAATGAHCGSAAGYGYRRAVVDDDGQVIALPGPGEWKSPHQGRATLRLGPAREVAGVRRIFHLYAEGETFSGIAERMAQEDWPVPPAGCWTRAVVTALLRNEKYAGVAVYGRVSRYLGGAQVRIRETDWIRVEGAHPAIVSQRLFRRTQARRVSRRLYSKQDFLPGLRSLFERYGTVTTRLIDQDPDLPCGTTLWRLFGSMRAACDAAGIPHQTLGEKRVTINRLKR